MRKQLTPKMHMLIESFDPEAEDWGVEFVRAGVQVGYSSVYVRKILMNNILIIRELKHREEYGMSRVERNRKLRQDFWEETMEGRADGGTIEMKDRLRASELWGKSEGDFVHKIEADLNVAPKLEEKLKDALEGEKSGSD